jgi:hypothetical protein
MIYHAKLFQNQLRSDHKGTEFMGTSSNFVSYVDGTMGLPPV